MAPPSIRGSRPTPSQSSVHAKPIKSAAKTPHAQKLNTKPHTPPKPSTNHGEAGRYVSSFKPAQTHSPGRSVAKASEAPKSAASLSSKGDVGLQAKDSKPVLSIKGVIAEGGELSANTIKDINEAAKSVPREFRRFIAYKDGVKVGGPLSWRANNPGNLRGSSTEIGKVPGAKGEFSIFKTPDDGRAAQKELYLRKYGDWTVDAAVRKLTPENENNVEQYLKDLAAQGINLTKDVKSQIEPLMPAIKRNEGSKEGTVVNRRP